MIAHEDITERKRMMTDLEASKLRYRTLFELHPSPLLAYDVETLGFLAVNRAAVEQYGYAKDEFLAMKITEIRPPEDIPALLEIVREQRESGRRRQGVWRHLKKDGSLIQVEVVSDRITLGGPASTTCLSHRCDRKAKNNDSLEGFRDQSANAF